MDGTYRISLRTPLGVQNGMLSLIQEEDALRGSIRAMGNANQFKNGKVNGNKFVFSGNLSMGFLNLNYTARGSVDGNKLNAMATTNLGTFPISGNKVIK